MIVEGELIMLKQDTDGLYTSKRISKAKLNSALNLGQVSRTAYFKLAGKIAKDIMNDKEPCPGEIARVRVDAVNDKSNLKGDFVIAVSLELNSYKVNNSWGKGRTMLVTKEFAELVFEHDLKRVRNVAKFCRENNITRDRYYKIRNIDVKQEATRKLLLKAKQKAKKRFEEKKK